MARKSETKEIDGVEYFVQALGARDALRVSQYLARVMAPLTRGMADKKPGAPKVAEDETAPSLLDLNIDSLPIERVIDRLAEPETLDMVLLLMKGCAADGRDLGNADTFDSHFAGRIDSLVKLVALCLKVNFGDFFERLGATPIGAQMAAAMGGASQTSEASDKT